MSKRLSAGCFAAVIKSFEQMDNPLRLNNFAMGLRELSRIVLHDLAPDADIEACCCYKEEKNKDGAFVPRASNASSMPFTPACRKIF
jgi:hypothetical protein